MQVFIKKVFLLNIGGEDNESINSIHTTYILETKFRVFNLYPVFTHFQFFNFEFGVYSLD